MVWPEPVDLFRPSWHESCWESLSQLFSFYQFITCCLQFMHAVFSFSFSVLSLSVTPFEVFGSPVAFKGSGKGNLLSYRRQAAGSTYVTTCLLCSVSTPLVSLYSHLGISPPAAYTLFPLAHTHIEMREQLSKCTHSWVVLVPTYTHTRKCTALV